MKPNTTGTRKIAPIPKVAPNPKEKKGENGKPMKRRKGNQNSKRICFC